MNLEFTLREHKFKGIFLRAYEHGKGNMIRAFLCG